MTEIFSMEEKGDYNIPAELSVKLENNSRSNGGGTKLRRGDVWKVKLEYGGSVINEGEALIFSSAKRHKVGVLVSVDRSQCYEYELSKRRLQKTGRSGCIVFTERVV